jgi:ribonuclease J
VGIPAENIQVIENGQVIEFEDGKMRLGERIPGGYVFVDGSGVGDVVPSVVREREILARDGFMLVNLNLDHNSCRLNGEPEIITRGFVNPTESDDLFVSTRRIVTEAIDCGKNGNLAHDLEETLKSYLYTRTKRRPLVFVTLSNS